MTGWWFVSYAVLWLAVVVLGVVIGCWLFIIGAAFLAVAACGWIFEYYRGIHAH